MAPLRPPPMRSSASHARWSKCWPRRAWSAISPRCNAAHGEKAPPRSSWCQKTGCAASASRPPPHPPGLQCCPGGEGPAAVIVVSEAGLRRLGLARTRAVQVLASVASSEELTPEGSPPLVELVRKSSAAALSQAGIVPKDLDIVELHDAFSIEELLYTEAIGICETGEGAAYVARGAADIGGGACAINPSGGLIGMGHPLGTARVGQIAEITRQLRG